MKKVLAKLLAGVFAVLGFGTIPTRAQTESFWTVDAAPANPDSSDAKSVELGMTFSSSVPGSVSGIRFYKGAGNGGIHIGNLWDVTGKNLAKGTFSGESASGWQTLTFISPVAIQAGATYVVSYLAPQGRYPFDQNFFATPVTAGPLTATGSRYVYGSDAFPTQTYNKTNYWVDVLFVPAPPPPPPAILNVTLNAKLSWDDGTPIAGQLQVQQLVAPNDWTVLATAKLDAAGSAAILVGINLDPADPLTLQALLLDANGNVVCSSASPAICAILRQSVPKATFNLAISGTATVVLSKATFAVRSIQFAVAP